MISFQAPNLSSASLFRLLVSTQLREDISSSFVDSSKHRLWNTLSSSSSSLLIFHVSLLKPSRRLLLWSGGRAVIYNRSNCCGLITSESPEEVKHVRHQLLYSGLRRLCYHITCVFITDSLLNMSLRVVRILQNYCSRSDKKCEKTNWKCSNMLCLFHLSWPEEGSVLGCDNVLLQKLWPLFVLQNNSGDLLCNVCRLKEDTQSFYSGFVYSVSFLWQRLWIMEDVQKIWSMSVASTLSLYDLDTRFETWAE